jgi:hypothetical protein
MLALYWAATTPSYTAGTRRDLEQPTNSWHVVDDQRGFGRGNRPLCGQLSIGRPQERPYH